MIALHEALLIERIEVKHPLPNCRVILAGCAVRFESDVRHRLMVCYYLHVVARQIGFVGAHFGHREVASRCLNQSLKLRTIAGVLIGYLDAGHDVGFSSAHQVNLDPFVALHHFLVAILRLDPLSKPTSREAGRIDSERGLNGLQWQTANLNQLLEEWCQAGILKVTGKRSVMRRSRQVSLAVRVFQIGSKAPSAHSRVNLERTGEDHVSQWQARTPECLRRFFDAFAQFIQQRENAFLFVDLSSIVGRPFLLVGPLDCDRLGVGLSLAIVRVLPLNDDLDGINMLTAEVSGGEVWTSAVRMCRVRLNDI